MCNGQQDLDGLDGPKGQLLRDNNKLKFARAITIFCIVPTLAFVITFTLQSLDEYRPHGTTTFTLLCFGVVAPSTFFIFNKNLRNFARKQLSFDFPKLWYLKRRPMVQPIV